MNDFANIEAKFSASVGNDTFSLYASTSAVFVGNSTVYSSGLGVTFLSAEWVYAITATATPFTTADNYHIEVIAAGSGTNFISRQAILSVDP